MFYVRIFIEIFVLFFKKYITLEWILRITLRRLWNSRKTTTFLTWNFHVLKRNRFLRMPSHNGYRGRDCLYGKLPAGSFRSAECQYRGFGTGWIIGSKGILLWKIWNIFSGATLIRCMPCYEPCPSTCTPTSHSCWTKTSSTNVDEVL